MRSDGVRWLAAAAALWGTWGLALAAAGLPSTQQLAVAAHAGPDDPRTWLARTDEALATRNYRGVFVHEFAGETETLQIVHRVGSDGLSERLQSMDGSGREFVRRDNQLFCYLPDRRMVLVEHSPDPGSLLTGLPNLDATLTGDYDLRQLARTRVSGRMARVIAIMPRDQLRYGYRVWIDETTAMPLKMQLRDERGHVLEQIVFITLVLPAHIPASELAPSIDARNYRWVVQQQDSAAPPASGLSVAWQAGSLPPGFRMTASARQMLPGGPAEHLVFSDGLASVSVFVQPEGGGAAQSQADDAATLGTSSAYSTVVQGYRVTVVGEVPPTTVREIAEAMRTTGPAPEAFAMGASAAPHAQGEPADAASAPLLRGLVPAQGLGSVGVLGDPLPASGAAAWGAGGGGFDGSPAAARSGFSGGFPGSPRRR